MSVWTSLNIVLTTLLESRGICFVTFRENNQGYQFSAACLEHTALIYNTTLTAIIHTNQMLFSP